MQLRFEYDSVAARRQVALLEERVLEDALRDGLRCAAQDNHYGFTVRLDPYGHDRGREPTYYQLRFSDNSLYVWLMPGPPEGR